MLDDTAGLASGLMTALGWGVGFVSRQAAAGLGSLAEAYYAVWA